MALEVDPDSSYAYYNRGITKDRKGDYNGAVQDFSAAIRLEPHNADFYHNRGFSLRKDVSRRGALVWTCAHTHVPSCALHATCVQVVMGNCRCTAAA